MPNSLDSHPGYGAAYIMEGELLNFTKSHLSELQDGDNNNFTYLSQLPWELNDKSI